MSWDPLEGGEWPSRGFIDLCARPASTEEALLMLPMYRSMGFRAVIIEAAPFLDRKRIEEEAARLSLRVGWRITVRAGKPGDIQKKLRSLRVTRTLTSVVPLSLEAARFAARSKDVDIITIEPGMERLVDGSTRVLFEQRGWGAVEIVLAHIVEAARGPERRLESVLRYLFLVARRAYGFKIPVVASSCAETRWEIVHPYHVAGLVSVPGIPPEESLSWMTSTPASVIARILERRK